MIDRYREMWGVGTEIRAGHSWSCRRQLERVVCGVSAWPASDHLVSPPDQIQTGSLLSDPLISPGLFSFRLTRLQSSQISTPQRGPSNALGFVKGLLWPSQRCRQIKIHMSRFIKLQVVPRPEVMIRALYSDWNSQGRWTRPLLDCCIPRYRQYLMDLWIYMYSNTQITCSSLTDNLMACDRRRGKTISRPVIGSAPIALACSWNNWSSYPPDRVIVVSCSSRFCNMSHNLETHGADFSKMYHI